MGDLGRVVPSFGPTRVNDALEPGVGGNES